MRPDIMNKVAIRTSELLFDQIKQGVDQDGKKYKYSTKPFVRPAGGLRTTKAQQASGDVRFFTAKKSGNMWVYIKGGYKAYREMKGRSGDDDFLQFSGRMLQSMATRVTGNDSAEVYFVDQQAAKQAFWLTVGGAGKSRSLWKFMGLTRANEEKLANYTASLLNEAEIIKIIS